MERDDTYFKLSFMKVINVDGEDLYPGKIKLVLSRL